MLEHSGRCTAVLPLWGLDTAQGMLLTSGFNWDRNDETANRRAATLKKMKKTPGLSQAGTYSSIMHYLKAVETRGYGRNCCCDAQYEADADQRILCKEWTHPGR